MRKALCAESRVGETSLTILNQLLTPIQSCVHTGVIETKAGVARVIEAVGNYGEMFQRDLGAGSVMKLPRGANKLWTQGGLMYALTIR
jgi:hypothetical protein